MKKKDFLIGFSVRLRNLRHIRNLSQNEFIRDLSVSKPTYVRYEAAEMMPKIAFLQELYVHFNVDLTWLITGLGEMFVSNTLVEPPHIYSEKNIPKKYVELFRLMEIPEIELSILMELEKAKRIFKSKVEKFSSAQKQNKVAR